MSNSLLASFRLGDRTCPLVPLADRIDNIQARHDFPKHGVPPVQVGCGDA